MHLSIVDCLAKKNEMQTERSRPSVKLIHLQTAAFSTRPLALTPITGKFAFPCSFQQIPVQFLTNSRALSDTFEPNYSLFPLTHLSCLYHNQTINLEIIDLLLFSYFWPNIQTFFSCFAEIAAKRCDFHNVHYKDVIKSRLDAHTLLRRGRWDGLMKKVAER